jgi:hypothetical protein
MPTTDTKFGLLEATTVAAALPNIECNFVKLQCRAHNTDGSANDNSILYGDSVTQSIEVEPGRASIWIGVQNASTLRVKALSGTCTVGFITSNRSAADLVE